MVGSRSGAGIPTLICDIRVNICEKNLLIIKIHKHLSIQRGLIVYLLQELNVPRVVAQLRQQRAYMVQTVAQYRFVYTLLIHYLKQTRLI